MGTSSKEKSWTVVHFLEDESVEAVPTEWIVGNNCYWPPWNQIKTRDAIKKGEPFSTCWPIHKIRQLRNSTFDDYLSARSKLQKACQTSDLNSESEGGSKRRRIKKRKVFDTSDSEESDNYSELPPPPTIILEQSSVMGRTKIANNGKTSNLIELADIHSPRPSSTCSTPVNRQTATISKHCCCEEVKKSLNSFHTDINNKMLSLKASILQIRDDLQNIVKPLASGPEEKFLMKFSFPITEKNDLQAVHDYLQDEDCFKDAVQQMSKLGGANPYEAIKRMFLATFSDCLAQNYTYDGTKEKTPFKENKLCSVILVAAEAYSADRKTAEACIRKWLRRAKERLAYKNTK